MNFGAIIIDNRQIDIDSVIKKHKKFLPTKCGIIHITDVEINDMHDYNRLLGSEFFWELIPFDKVLIFQADSGLLRTGIEEFLEYDYIGAPYDHIDFPAMNGGFSLRTKSVMMDIVKKFPYNVSIHGNEDLYFSTRVPLVGGKLPTKEIAQKFSVETIFSLGSLGYHAIEGKFSEDKVKEILTQYE